MKRGLKARCLWLEGSTVSVFSAAITMANGIFVVLPRQKLIDLTGDLSSRRDCTTDQRRPHDRIPRCKDAGAIAARVFDRKISLRPGLQLDLADNTASIPGLEAHCQQNEIDLQNEFRADYMTHRSVLRSLGPLDLDGVQFVYLLVESTEPCRPNTPATYARDIVMLGAARLACMAICVGMWLD